MTAEKGKGTGHPGDGLHQKGQPSLWAGWGSCVLLLLAICGLLILSLFVGTVHIPASEVWSILSGADVEKSSWRFIVLETRLPAALTAVLCGASLAACGLMLQTAFRNPLAGPSVFGITHGASLGVALVMLLSGGTLAATQWFSFPAVLASAFAGAIAVTALILGFSLLVRSNVMLLIIGIMIGYLSSAVVALLNFAANEEGVRSYMMWGLGTFGNVSLSQLPLFAIPVLLGLVGSCLLIKPLNALLLGDCYAQSLGIDVRRVRSCLLLLTGLLCAAATAFCGPIAFIGLAVPHIARIILGTANHRQLLPATILTGAVVALVCHLSTHVFGGGQIVPVNAVTPLIGAPVVIYVVLKKT